MELTDFKKIVKFRKSSEHLRERYIENFVDTNREYYRKYIKTLKNYKDGNCYEGYLWDTLFKCEIADYKYIADNIKEYYSKNILVMWDIHSEEKIFIPDYWKFNKDDIIEFPTEILTEAAEYLPEDIYIFDERFERSFILTHEETDNGRYCLIAHSKYNE